MIKRLRGRVETIADDHLIVDIGAFGVQVYLPPSHLSRFQPGQTAGLYTHLHVREQDISLFGFVSEEDLTIFELLLAVNGVGPRLALSMLSTLSPEVLQSAIVNDDPAVLTRVPGIGAKTARNILFQLKDKLAPTLAYAGVELRITDTDAEVIEALTSLGYSIIEAQRALQKVPREASGVEERLRLALAQLAP